MTLFTAIIGGVGSAGWVYLAATSRDQIAAAVYLALALVATVPLASFISERRKS